MQTVATNITLVDYDTSNPAHKRAFADLNREWLTRYFEVEPYDEVAFADPVAFALAQGGVILFACDGEAIIGTGSLVRMDEQHFEIAKMAVTQQYQARSAGTMLLRELIARARAKSARKLFIVSNTSLAPAMGLYRRYGFKNSTETHHSHYARGNVTLELII